jgi:hypothetical protein
MHIVYDEEELPNVKRMHVVEEEVLLSQPETATVPPEEEEVLVLQGSTAVVPPEEEVLPEKVEVATPPCHGPAAGPHNHGPAGGRIPTAPPVTVLPEEEDVLAHLVVVLSEGKGCLVPVPPLVSSSPFFFFKNAGDSSRPFSHKHGRFVG